MTAETTATPAGEPAGEQGPDSGSQVDGSGSAPAEADQVVAAPATEQATPSEETPSDGVDAEEAASAATPPANPGAGS
ncbi:MAG: hypothetical protein JWP61_192 [Friedmanniella sp.]|nr:hypothetical protein [Friedmanniella sp.]